MQASETSQDSVGVIERPSLRAAAALNPIRQGSTPATAENTTEAPAQPQQPQQDVSDSDSEVGIPTSCGFAVQGGVGSSGVGGARLLSASLPPMAPPTLSSLPRHPTESSQSHSHDDPLLAGGNANAMSHSSQFYNSQSQSHTVGQLPGIISNSGSFRNMAPAGNNNNNQGMATPSSQGLIGVVGSENGGSGVYSQTPSMTRFRADPALHHQHQQQPTFSNTNHVLSPSPPSSKGGAAGNTNSTYTTVMIGSGGTAGGSGTFSGRGVGARTVGGSDNLSHSNGSGFQAALQGEHFYPLQVSPSPGNIGTTNGHGSSANYVHIQGSNVPMHPVPNQQSASVASHASDNVGSQSFTGSIDAAAGSHGHGALSRFSYPQQQPLSYIPSTTTAIGNNNNTAYKNHQQFHSPLVPVGPPTASAAADCSGGSFVVSSNNNNNNNHSGSFDGVRVGVTPMMSSYQVHNHHHNIAFNQSSSTSNRYNTTRNTSSSPNPPTTVNNHTTTTTSGFMTTTPSDLLMTSNHNNYMNSSSPLMAMFNNNTANSTPHQQYHHHKQHQQAFHMSSSLPLSEGPLTLVSPANAVTNSSCLSGDVPMSGGAIPTYETTGRPMDAFEMAMLREQYLHGAFHVAVDPNDMAGKKKRRRRKRKKNANGADMSGNDEDNDDAANNGAGTGVEGSLKNAPKPDIKSKSRVLIVPGVPVHLPLVGKVGFIPYATILKQYASLQAKKTQSAPAATTTNATTTAKPDFANDTANAVDAAIKSADAADEVDDDDDAAAPPSYTDVLFDDDDKATAAATTSTAQARLFVGQVPYSIELDLMKAIFFVIGGGCDVDHVERIVKWKNRELPSGCLHVHINVEYKLSDHPEGSNTDPTETSSVVHHALKLDQVALLDDEGIWVPTSNRRAFSIVDTHVEAFEAFLSRQNEHEASAAAAAATATSATATTTRSQCGGSTDPSPAASQDLSQYGPAPMPRTMGTFGLTFDEFKGFLKGCAKEVRNTMPDYAVTWSEEDDRLGHVDTNTTSHLPPVPVIHPDIAAIAIHGRNGGAHAIKPPTSAATQDTQHQNEGAHQVDSAAATVVVSGAVANPCEAVAKGLLCLPVPGFGGTLPHTRPLTFTHNNTASANTKDINGSSQSTTTSNCEGEKPPPSTQQEQPHHVTSTLIVRPPKGPEDPEFVVPSLSDQRDALVAYVAYLKDMTSMVCRPIDRPYQLMSVQRARSTFLPQKSASSKNNSSNQASSTKNQPANNNINNGNNIAAAQQRVQSHNGGSGFSTSTTTPFHPTHHHQQQQPMFPNQQHYDPTFLMQQQQHQAMLYHQQQQQQQFHHYQQQNQQHQQFGFTNHQQQNQNNFTPHMQPHQHQHVQQTTNMYGGYQQIGGSTQQQQTAFQNNNTNNNKKNNNASLMYQQQQPTQNHFNNSNNTNNPPIYHQHQQQQHPIYWKQ